MSTVVPAGMFPDLPDCSFLSAQKSLKQEMNDQKGALAAAVVAQLVKRPESRSLKDVQLC